MLRGARAGLFATRSPFRPNPLGLTLVKLDGVSGDTLLLSGVDMVDGSPVYDIKPYMPQYDAPPELAIANAAVMEPGSSPPVRSTSWAAPPLRVSLSVSAMAGLRDIVQNRKEGLMSDYESLEQALKQVLAADPRPLYRWRRQQQQRGSALYEIVVDGVRAQCRFEADESVLVLSCESDTSSLEGDAVLGG
eukprot:CAMPEP_0119347710 /NCGR_PEP_ID=MMETSP1333-20130426/108667_1 /TAXON_ID=418940 /ORGANISM="Scyphosphaera apsteinii, Strain RCC1455" /LENGTH=190 /DNA_ID=CAMNT_0007360267 /DNA_START=427 /DNA_END=999 /DNA_ORIENTATION=+